MIALKAFSERSAFVIILAASIVFSLAGVAIAVWLENPAHGGRGGAIGVAISFAALFATRPYGDQFFRVFGADTDEVLDLLEMSGDNDQKIKLKLDRVNRGVALLVAKLKIDAQGQKRQNVFLAWSGGISTLFWGFGDLLACLLSSRLSC